MITHKLNFCLFLLALATATAQVCTNIQEGINAAIQAVEQGTGMVDAEFTKVLVDGNQKSVYFMGRYEDTGDGRKKTIFVKTDEELVVTLVKAVEVGPNIYSFAADPSLALFYFQGLNGEVFYEVSPNDFSVMNATQVGMANFTEGNRIVVKETIYFSFIAWSNQGNVCKIAASNAPCFKISQATHITFYPIDADEVFIGYVISPTFIITF